MRSPKVHLIDRQRAGRDRDGVRSSRCGALTWPEEQPPHNITSIAARVTCAVCVRAIWPYEVTDCLECGKRHSNDPKTVGLLHVRRVVNGDDK